jgi:hypothetical protein
VFENFIDEGSFQIGMKWAQDGLHNGWIEWTDLRHKSIWNKRRRFARKMSADLSVSFP